MMHQCIQGLPQLTWDMGATWEAPKQEQWAGKTGRQVDEADQTTLS